MEDSFAFVWELRITIPDPKRFASKTLYSIMANQSAFTSALGHDAGEIARLHIQSNPHLDVLSGRGMINDGSAYLPTSKRPRLGLCEKIGDTIDHQGFVRYQIDGKE